MALMVSDEGDDPISLFMLGGLLRGDIHWQYEIVVEIKREIRHGDGNETQKAFDHLCRVILAIGRGSFMEGIAGLKKCRMVIEVTMMLD